MLHSRALFALVKWCRGILLPFPLRSMSFHNCLVLKLIILDAVLLINVLSLSLSPFDKINIDKTLFSICGRNVGARGGYGCTFFNSNVGWELGSRSK